MKEPRDMTENEVRYHCAAMADENKTLRAALADARKIISNYWPLWTPEYEPEKSTIDVLNKIDAALKN